MMEAMEVVTNGGGNCTLLQQIRDEPLLQRRISIIKDLEPFLYSSSSIASIMETLFTDSIVEGGGALKEFLTALLAFIRKEGGGTQLAQSHSFMNKLVTTLPHILTDGQNEVEFVLLCIVSALSRGLLLSTPAENLDWTKPLISSMTRIILNDKYSSVAIALAYSVLINVGDSGAFGVAVVVADPVFPKVLDKAKRIIKAAAVMPNGMEGHGDAGTHVLLEIAAIHLFLVVDRDNSMKDLVAISIAVASIITKKIIEIMNNKPSLPFKEMILLLEFTSFFILRLSKSKEQLQKNNQHLNNPNAIQILKVVNDGTRNLLNSLPTSKLVLKKEKNEKEAILILKMVQKLIQSHGILEDNWSSVVGVLTAIGNKYENEVEVTSFVFETYAHLLTQMKETLPPNPLPIELKDICLQGISRGHFQPEDNPRSIGYNIAYAKLMSLVQDLFTGVDMFHKVMEEKDSILSTIKNLSLSISSNPKGDADNQSALLCAIEVLYLISINGRKSKTILDILLNSVKNWGAQHHLAVALKTITDPAVIDKIIRVLGVIEFSESCVRQISNAIVTENTKVRSPKVHTFPSAELFLSPSALQGLNNINECLATMEGLFNGENVSLTYGDVVGLYQRKMTWMDTQLKIAKEQIEQAKLLHAETEKILEEQTEQILNTLGTLETKEKMVADLGKEVDEQRIKIRLFDSAVQAKAEAYRLKLVFKQKQMEDLDRKMKEKDLRLSALESEKKEILKSIKKDKDLFQKEKTVLDEKNKTHEKTIGTLQQKISALEHEIAEAKEERTTLEHQLQREQQKVEFIRGFLGNHPNMDM